LKFAADTTLRRLSKWLRIMGYDCIYPAVFDEQKFDDKRLFLTRSASVKGTGIVFIGCNNIKDQIAVLTRILPIMENIQPFSRCVVCNIALKILKKDEVLGDVPDHIHRTHDNFRFCSNCKRVFWPGTHKEKMEKQIETFFK
jgi:uncharacterized protein